MTASRAERWWLAAAVAVAVVVALPLFGLLWTAARGSDGLWSHLAAHVLPHALANTICLLLGVATIAFLIGTVCAWLVSAYDFPGRRIFGWALLLPLAVPSYIVAFAYLDLLHPLGPAQSALRALLGFDSPREFRLPDLRSLSACIVLLGLVLYPYVYLTVRAMFVTQAASLIEAARSLGVGGAVLFWRVALPLARPALAAGVALVMLETLNDVGASEFLGVKTLTVAVYTTWITRGDLPGAAQIACAMLAVVIVVLALERYGRSRRRYTAGMRSRLLQRQRLDGTHAYAAAAFCALPVLLGFVLPAMHLAIQTIERLLGQGVSAQLLASVWNTLWVAGFATVLTLIAGFALAGCVRLARSRRRRDAFARLGDFALRVGALGYALPGTVLAIALLAPLSWFDSAAAAFAKTLGIVPMLLMGSTLALALAYAIRFLAIASGGIESGFARIPLPLDQSARTLGAGVGRSLVRVHLPLLRPALAAAALLVFIDAMKELPATLLLRPLNFETLATWLYAEAARGTYEEGAVAALLIVLAGLPAVLLMNATLNASARATVPPTDADMPSSPMLPNPPIP
jgi:iron(III) transport system permease protein